MQWTHLGEAAIVFSVLEGTAFITGGATAATTAAPAACGFAVMIYHNGINKDELTKVIAAMQTKATVAPQATNTAPGGNTQGGGQTPPTPQAVAISYSYDGHTMTVTPNSPIGTVEPLGNASYTVGNSYGPLTLPSGANIPASSVYIGQGEFENAGNFFN